jgi:hypothetical protein
MAICELLSATESTVKPASGKKEVSLHQTGDHTFAYERFNLQSDLNYYLLANQTRSEVFSIKVFDPPALETIELSYDYPAYTGFKPTVQHQDGNLRAIVGNRKHGETCVREKRGFLTSDRRPHFCLRTLQSSIGSKLLPVSQSDPVGGI